MATQMKIKFNSEIEEFLEYAKLNNVDYLCDYEKINFYSDVHHVLPNIVLQFQ